MAKVKICGLNDARGFDAAIAGGADYVGFVFFPPSPRNVAPAAAAALSARAAGGPLRVGLFVDPAPADVARVLHVLHLDIAQVHGTAAQARAVRQSCGIAVWHAVGVAQAADLPIDLEGADALLLDAKPPKGATRPGGNAASFDWSVLRAWSPPGPWILAGGLTPENVAACIAETGAPVVDVSSGVESSPGVKDPARIAAFIAAARA